ncbi:MAG: hypothetical protein ACREBE_05630 [bacterium]
MRIRHLVTVAALVAARDSARAQHVSFGAQVVPLLTRADPTPVGHALTEGYLTQPVIMGHAAWGYLRGVATANLEGLTLERGELNTGSYGEGYVDRRHPHTYVHELLAGAEIDRGATRASLFFGRGFAPFGTDDPMSRPIVKYPINHHLAQVLERIVAVAAVRQGPAIVELGVFNGDEPLSPFSAPNWSRFGDSWSTRLTLLPIAGAELVASYASVASPEVRAGGGLDQRKASASARYSTIDSTTWRYGLVEWARTNERDRGVTSTRLSSVLAEGAYCRAGTIAVARVEQTDRPEEEQLSDPFRTPRPPIDLTNLGVSRWTTATLSLSPPAFARGSFSGRPFVEIARTHAAPGNPPGVFSAERRYGSSSMWVASAGARLRFGSMHGRMGRYGAADPDAAAMNAGTHAHGMESHQVMDMSAHASAPAPMSPVSRCTL